MDREKEREREKKNFQLERKNEILFDRWISLDSWQIATISSYLLYVKRKARKKGQNDGNNDVERTKKVCVRSSTFCIY